VQEKENEEEFKKKVEEQLKSATSETDEERAIRERRERRMAILAKYAKDNAQPSDKQAAEVKPEPMQVDTKPELKSESVANGIKKEEANGHVKSELTMTQHVFDEISNDVPDNDFKKKVEEKVDDDSGFDMFADDSDGSPDDDRVPKGTKLKTLNVREADPSEDEQGYYRYRIGERLNNRFQVTGHHGKGVFSNVLSGIDEQTGQPVAIKLLRNNDHMKRAGQKEMAILAQLSTADPEGRYNTIKLLDHFEDRDRLCLVFEPMDMNLRELVKKYGNRVGLGVKAVRVYAFKLFKALLLLKRNNIIHADLKPDNILVKDKSIVKLADLGSAYEYNPLEPDIYNGYLASRYYRAPEIILGLDYSFPIDVFSLGCTLYELARGKFMFQSKNNNHHLKVIMEAKGKFPKKMLQKGRLRPVHFDDNLNFKERLVDPVTGKIFEKIHTISIKQARNINTELLQSYSDDISDQEKKLVSLLADLIDKCTAIDPAKRITPDEALKHAFFTEFTKPPPVTAAPATGAPTAESQTEGLVA
jgi:serine/threonine-protein kinase PRP4